MANFGGFYKGDKKKPKKGQLDNLAKKVQFSTQPTFTLPEILPKGKIKNEE